MKAISFVALAALTSCASLGDALVTIGTAVYAGVDAYARATRPPARIAPLPRYGARMRGVVYADDDRIPYWCADEASRVRIEAHCAKLNKKSITSTHEVL